MIYFIQDLNNKRVKIGKSDNPIRRVRRFKTGSSNPEGFEILAVIPGGVKREKELHQRFKQYHSHGEWFEFSKEIFDYVHENTSGEFNFCRICGCLHLAKPNNQDIEGHAKLHNDMRKGIFSYSTRELLKSMARAALSGQTMKLEGTERDEAKRIIALAWWARAKQTGISDSSFDDFMLDHLDLIDAQYDGKGNLQEISKRVSKTWRGA